MRKCFTLPVIRILFIGMLTLTSCHLPQMASLPTPIAETLTATLPQPTRTVETVPPTPTHTATITPSATPVPPTETPSPTPTATWVFNEAGLVVAPILLYHHVNGDFTDSRYRVSIPDFRDQMQALSDQGYTAITISTLLDALLYGGELPEKPIVITFDDGHHSVFEYAFPIMQAHGFPGVFYIVANRIYDVPDFVNIEQITTMVDAGWEIGSHGYTHVDITKNHASAAYEVGQSRADLKAALNTEVNTFAYPYGEVDPFVAQNVSNAQYQAGMGLGGSITHTLGNLFYLHRIEVHGGYTVEHFIALITP